MNGSFNSPRLRGPFRPLRILIGLALAGFVLFQLWQKGLDQPGVDPQAPRDKTTSRTVETDTPRDAAKQSSKAGAKGQSSAIPANVMTVLAHVDQTGEPLEGYEGRRKFLNLGRDGEEKLPQFDARRKAIEYREWDVNPHVAGKNRGAERLVTGSDGSAYFTSDHYRTFTKIR